MTGFDLLNFILALVGIVIAVLTLGWTIHRDVTDRGKLKVSCMIGNLLGGDGPPDPTDYFMWTVTNVGKQPTYLKSFGGGKKMPATRHFMMVPQTPLPRRLEPGESVQGWTANIGGVLENIDFMAAYDSCDRLYKLPRRALRRVLEDYSQLQQANPNHGRGP